jgi:hypothetical protein
LTDISHLPGQPPKHGLAELARKGMAAVLPRPAVHQNLPGQLGQAKGVVQLTEDKQTASDVTLDPWNSSFRRRSKPIRRSPDPVSPATIAMSSRSRNLYNIDFYIIFVRRRH